MSDEGFQGDDLPRDLQSLISSCAIRPPSEDTLNAIAGLSDSEYETVRKSCSQNLGWRLNRLDSERSKRATRGNSNSKSVNGTTIQLRNVEVESVAEPVDVAQLIADLETILSDFVYFPNNESQLAVTLWILYSYTYESFDHNPILLVRSPFKRSGKTQLMKMLYYLSHRTYSSSSCTPAAIFRIIETYKPTLLIDEGDTFIKNNEDMRGLLNAGFDREQAFFTRAVATPNSDHKVCNYNVYAPRAIALIGNAPETVEDRSVIINIQRKSNFLRVNRHPARYIDLFTQIVRKLTRFRIDNLVKLKSMRLTNDELEVFSSDRAADAWEPLLLISKLGGKELFERTTQAARVLTRGLESDDANASKMLIHSIADLLPNLLVQSGAHPNNDESLLLVGVLYEKLKTQLPWSEWGRSGRPITKQAVTKILAPFDIHTYQKKYTDPISGKVKNNRCYRVDELVRACESYVEGFSVATSLPTSAEAGSQGSSTFGESSNVALLNPEFSASHCDGSEVVRKLTVHEMPCAKCKLLSGRKCTKGLKIYKAVSEGDCESFDYSN